MENFGTFTGFNYVKELSFAVLMMIIVILDMISKILYHLVIYTNAFTEKNIMLEFTSIQ